MNNRAWDGNKCYSSRYAEDGCPDTDNCRLQFIGLEVGQKFLYIFDFGEEWHFQCKILQVLYEDTKCPEIVRTKGIAPPQYPEFDEGSAYYDDDEYFDDDEEEIIEHEKLPIPVPDELYDKALCFRKVKLWSKLNETDIFAVKLSNGETGYCSVVGRNCNYYSLTLYIGEKGLFSYYRLINSQCKNDDETFEYMMSQNCLQICFDNKNALRLADLNSVQDYAKRKNLNFRGAHSYPFILSIKPYYIPWYVEDKSEYELLKEALDAAMFVSKKLNNTSAEKLGFTEDSEIPYIVPNSDGFDLKTMQLPSELTETIPSPSLNASKISKLKKLKQSSKWECKVKHINNPIQDDITEAPYFPAILIAVECSNDYVLPIEPIRDYDINAQILLDSLADELLKYEKLPKTICISDDITYNLLLPLCKECGIELKSVDVLKKADKIFEELNETNEDDDLDKLMRIIDFLDSLSVEEIKNLPSEIKTMIKSMIGSGIFELDLEAKLRRAFNIK